MISFWTLSGLIAAIMIGANTAYGDEVDPLLKCLEDPDYGELLDIVRNGLPHAKTPRHIVIVGGGVAGLTAAKYLEDAGHKVGTMLFVCRSLMSKLQKIIYTCSLVRKARTA